MKKSRIEFSNCSITWKYGSLSYFSRYPQKTKFSHKPLYKIPPKMAAHGLKFPVAEISAPSLLEYIGELPLFYIRHFTRLVKSQRKDTTQPLHMKVNMRFVVGIDETHRKNQEPVRSNIAIRIYRGITTFLYKAFYQTC